MKKRIISLALVLIMVLGLIPTALAAENAASAWHSFRGSDSNMAVTDAKTPAAPETTVLKWARQFQDAKPTPQIIADNALITMSGTTLYKLDLQTGETIATGTMAAASRYTYTPPAYANGVIYCALNDGIVQAFDAVTLEAKWKYTDELGGQDQVPVTCSDGYVYTGFYSGSETGTNASFVCLNANTGEKVWSREAEGGFYWTAPVVIGDTIIIGSDNGAGTSGAAATADSHVYSLNKKTGAVISDITVSGDQRSGIAYSAEKGRIYFTTKAGFLCSAAVDAAAGTLSDVRAVDQGTASTSTPIVYGDKVYFGLSRSLNGNATGFAVADADTLEQLYVVKMKGYPQCSFLLSTAYYETEGKLYFYSTYNAEPGGLSLIKVDPAKNTADGAELVEIYRANGYSQYCINSPICGADGTIYYKNDSGAVMAVGINEAYLSGLSSNVGEWNADFSVDVMEYELVVPIGTASVTLTPTCCEGGTAAVQTVDLVDGAATAFVAVTKGDATRTYTVSIREAMASASLGELKVSENNSYTNTATDKELSPAFAADTLFYKVTTITNSDAASFFARVWPTAADPNATVKAYAVSNIKDGKFDEETGELPSGKSSDHTRFGVYFADITKPAVIRIAVTAEDGVTVQNYTLVLSTEDAATEAGKLLKNLEDQAAADAVIEKIDAIGEVTLSSAAAIQAARTAYNALSADQKALVTNVDTLTAAEARLEQLKDEATGTPVNVYVTIADKGSVVMAQKKLSVTDVNNNGIFDVDDALYAAHEAGFAGGAAAGYSSYWSTWGLSIGMLWGDTSYAFGYWLNDASCRSLEDTVAEGDHLVAFVYTDGTGWSDAYSKFEKNGYVAEEDTALTVKLEKAGYDENWNTVFSAHTGAVITVYDSEMKVVNATVTDNGNGAYTVVIADPGTYCVVATDSDPLIVPAVCAVTVSAKAAEPGEPDDPTVPGNPGDSNDPTDPTEPSEPAGPGNPTEPSVPGNPAEPSVPGNPTEPGNSEKPGEPAEPGNPATGDSSGVVLMSVFLLSSLCGVVALTVISGKKFF